VFVLVFIFYLKTRFTQQIGHGVTIDMAWFINDAFSFVGAGMSQNSDQDRGWTTGV
jgi:hypothetical protein